MGARIGRCHVPPVSEVAGMEAIGEAEWCTAVSVDVAMYVQRMTRHRHAHKRSPATCACSSSTSRKLTAILLHSKSWPSWCRAPLRAAWSCGAPSGLFAAKPVHWSHVWCQLKQFWPRPAIVGRATAVSAEAAAGPGNGTPILWSASIAETWEYTWLVARCWATSSSDVEVVAGLSFCES